MNAVFLTFYLQTFLSALIAVSSFYRYTERSTVIKLVGILFALSFVCNVTSYSLFFFNYRADLINVPGSVFDSGTVIIATIIYNHLTKSRYKTAFLTIAVLFLSMALFNLLFFQKVNIASYNLLAGSFIMMIYSVFYFHRLMVEMPTVHLQRLPMFWFNSAFLIYHAGGVFLFAFTEYLITTMNDSFVQFATFRNALFFAQQLIILIGIVYDLKSVKISTRTEA
jgi:hypothetical protein